MGDREVARARRMGYTESEASETVANVAPVLFANLQVAGTLLDFPATAQLARA